jgi:hypothetical protein
MKMVMIATAAYLGWWLIAHHHPKAAPAPTSAPTASVASSALPTTSPPPSPNTIPGDVSNDCVEISYGTFCPMGNNELDKELIDAADEIAKQYLQTPVGSVYDFQTEDGKRWVGRVRMHTPVQKGITLYKKKSG